MKAINKIFASKFWWLLLLAGLFVLNFLASFVHARFDLTKEKRYTLSKATKNLVAGLDDKVQIDVFLKGEFPAKFRKLTNRVKEFLQMLKESNSSQIQFKFISPNDIIPNSNNRTYADTLISMGATPINLKAQVKTGESSSFAFPYAVISYKENEELVTLFSAPQFIGGDNETPEQVINKAEALMEFQFAKAIDKLSNDKRPLIVYATGNGEPTDFRVVQLEQALTKDYRFGPFDISSSPVPVGADVLMIVKPTQQFSENEKLKIDQFVMGGGKLLCFIDNLIAEQDSLSIKPEIIAYDRNLNLTDLFFKYGLRIKTDLVMDLQCDVLPFVIGGSEGNPQMEFLKWNYYPVLLSANKKLGKNLGYVSARFANSIDTIQVNGIRKEPLLITSPNSRIISTPALISLNENKNTPEDIKFNKNAIPVAMLLEGRFTSLFKNKISKSELDSLAAYKLSFKEVSSDNKIIVVADGDIVFNDFIPPSEPNQPPEPIQMGWNKYTYTEYLKKSELSKFFIPVANKEFLLNCVELLVNNPAISETRNKDIVLRLLDSKKVAAQKSTWQFINIGLPVLLIILFGWIYQQIRKRKYAA
jgi:gliding-associated putative ABC transporter substrate-binding component GldG